MKKILIPALFATALLAGCNVLDKEPLTAIAPSNYFRNAQDAESSITACYDALQRKGYYAEVQNLIGNMPSDDCSSLNGDVRNLDVINWNSSTGQVYDAYRDPYVAVNRANTVLQNVPGIDMNATRRNEILGEARFIRALSYFTLVRLYGAVPLRLDPIETTDAAALNRPRASVEAVYTQIVADLTEADNLLPLSNPTRAAKGAANALLARVQLTQRKWAEAKDAAAKVLAGNGGYSLLPSFDSLYPADNKSESIFEIQFSGAADAGTSFTLPDILLPQPLATYSFLKFNIPTPDLLNTADQVNDLRWSDYGSAAGGTSHASYLDRGPGSGNDSGPFVYKWRSNGNGFNSSDNYYVLRLAEVYLAYAEAANEAAASPTQDALDHLNMIRQRAGLAALTLSDPEAASQQALRQEIDKQRRLELAFEGERWFDLIRYARHEQATPTADHAVTALDLIAQFHNGNRDVNYLLFPIPLSELNSNTQIQQNPGY